MKRVVTENLIQWKKGANRKPLILNGVRQCGKTYILNEFGREHYESVAYFNFESMRNLGDRFEEDLNTERLIIELSILCGKKINPHTTLIIFDEIQFCGKALTSLKYFNENNPEYHIVCAGSLLGIALSRPTSFPVGKVDVLTLRPMSFYEFLMAHGEEMLLDYLDRLDVSTEALSPLFTATLQMLLKNYFITGGMPEAVAKWIETKDVRAVEVIQEQILNSYELDFSKHAPLNDFPKISAIWRGIPDQLARENSKFVFGHAKKGARAKDLGDALEWLIRAGMVHKVNLIETPSLPLSAYSKPNYFKIYVADIGLLRKMAHLPAAALFDESPQFKEFKGALTENYVLNELMTNQKQTTPYFWRSGNSAEVDFLIQSETLVIPVEVKSNINVKSRSLKLYRDKYKPQIAIRTSMQDLKRDHELINLPLYLFWQIKKII